MPESDPQFCANLQDRPRCEQATALDNCNTIRTVDCGACPSAMGCVEHFCQTPVCTTFNYSSSAYSAFSYVGSEDFVVAASASGESIVYAQSQANVCGPFSIVLADETAPSSNAYTSRPITDWLTTTDMFVGHEMGTLSGDGLTFIGMSSDQTKIESARRSALQRLDFGVPSTSDFVLVNAGVARASGKIRAPAISADGLELYFTVNGVSTTVDGIYRSVRASSGVQFPVGQRVAVLTSDYEFVTAISSDRLALFVFKNFTSNIFTRWSTNAEFSNPNAPSIPPAIGGWEHKPFRDCATLVGTSSAAGGCQNEDVYFFHRQ